MGKAFLPTQTVFDRDGRKLYFRRDLCDGTAIVSRWLMTEGWDGEAEEYISDEPIIANAAQLHLSPPTEVLAGEVSDLHAKIETARQELSFLQHQAREAETEHKRMLATITAAEPLRNIEAFIAGKITHFVVIDQSYGGEFYGGVAVEPFEKGITYLNDRGRAEGMRLLSLYGGSKGDLTWRINHYSDGSGSHKLVVPCLSEDEARAKALETIELFWKGFSPKGNDYRITAAVKSADALGFEVPIEIRAHVEAKAVEGLAANVEKARQALAVAEAQLAAKNGGAA